MCRDLPYDNTLPLLTPDKTNDPEQQPASPEVPGLEAEMECYSRCVGGGGGCRNIGGEYDTGRGTKEEGESFKYFCDVQKVESEGLSHLPGADMARSGVECTEKGGHASWCTLGVSLGNCKNGEGEGGKQGGGA